MALATDELSHAPNTVREGWILTSIYSDRAVFEAKKRTLSNRTWHFLVSFRTRVVGRDVIAVSNERAEVAS